jgi:nitrogen regulatory protein P-II 1
MFKVDAVVRPQCLNEVKEALLTLGISDFVIAEVHGHGSGPGKTGMYRGATYQIPFVHQLRIELSVAESALDVVLERVVAAACTGEPGDGKIFVTAIEEVIDISDIRPNSFVHDRVSTRPRLAATADTSFSSAW